MLAPRARRLPGEAIATRADTGQACFADAFSSCGDAARLWFAHPRASLRSFSASFLCSVFESARGAQAASPVEHWTRRARSQPHWLC